jgi:hypothetical protein
MYPRRKISKLHLAGNQKNKRKTRKKSIRGKSGHPLDESTSPVRGVPRSRSRYNLRKGAAWDKNS